MSHSQSGIQRVPYGCETNLNITGENCKQYISIHGGAYHAQFIELCSVLERKIF